MAIPRAKDHFGKEVKLPARIEPYRDQKLEPPLPDVAARHLIDWLMEAGPVEPAAMGQAPLGWRTIRAWAVSTFQRPSAWEARQLRRMSGEYLAELHAAEDHTRPSPWLVERTEVNAQEMERRLRSVLG